MKEDFATLVAAVGKAMKEGSLSCVEHPRYGKFTALNPSEQIQVASLAAPQATESRSLDAEMKRIIDQHVSDPLSDPSTFIGGLPGFRNYENQE